MANKITEDMIKGQWNKQNTAHDAQWKAIVHMAQELGLSLDEDGNVVERKEKVQTVAPSPSVPSIDINQIKAAVKAGVKEALPSQTTAMPKTVVSSSSTLQDNKAVIAKAAEHWNPLIQGFVDSITEAYGIAKDGEEPPIIEERIAQKIVKVHKFIGKILRWLIEDMFGSLKKFAAYEIAFCCAMFGAYQYYQNQRLLPQHKKDAVIRYILSGDPSNKAMIEKIDTLLESKGADDIYKLMMRTKPNTQ